MKKVFSKTESLKKDQFRYCPGCGHSIAHRLIAEVIDQFNIRDRTIGIAPIGCAVFAYDYFDFDVLEIPHGRPPAAATGIKRVCPDKIVFTYQGDGDLAAIGIAEIIHAANRGENITVFFINNANYGMTGGQMAPTTLMGQRTTTSPLGRGIDSGYPIHIAELLSGLEATSFIARGSLDSYKNILTTKKYIETAFKYQIENKGFTLIEILSPCPTDWGMTPEESLKWLRENMIKEFKLGIIKNKWNKD